MGVTLPKPLMTKVEERDGNNIFRVGSSCVNGYRENMEDAHIAELNDTWGFFGVFDGHVNENCSAYLEGAFREYLNKNPGPMSDEAMKEAALAIDKAWLDKGADGGSTGTFFLAHKDGNNIHLQVGNVGDSRVLVCKAGRCLPMTEDHKPNNTEERNRIESLGGRVENNRVDGSLAVSRAFGDRDYKQSGGDQLNQKVIALADITHVTLPQNSATEENFAVLCCDGVFESSFSNEEVIEFIKEQLQTEKDLAVVAGLVCDEAVNRGSRDNISCMIVQFCDGSDMRAKPHLSVVPGPFSTTKSAAFLKMYKEMAEKGKMTVDKALELRYDTMMNKGGFDDQEEKEIFGAGPPADKKNAARTLWFNNLYEQHNKAVSTSRGSEQMARFQALHNQIGLPLPVLLALMGEGQDMGQ